MAFELKSREELYKEMVKQIELSFPRQLNLEPGSVLMTIIGVIAEQMCVLHEQIMQLQINAVQTWIYPDGTRSVNKPKDGEKFTLHTDPYNSDEFVWSDSSSQWHRVAHNSTIKLEQAIEFVPISITIEGAKCNCGSEKVGSPRHSDWCDRYDPNQ